MTPRKESSPPYAPVYAEMAEITVADPAFRQADGEPFNGQYISMDEIDAHADAKAAARAVLFDAIVSNQKAPEAAKKWEMSRIAALREVGGTALGSFSSYFAALNGEVHATRSEVTDLPEGDYSVIRTNGSIVTANRLYEAPVEFLDTSLGIIERRKHQDRSSIGPENYATALKYFTNKYANLDEPSEEVAFSDVYQLTTDVLKGFIDASRRDEPNFVEMTNIYTSIRTLPIGSVDKVFTKPLLQQSLRSLPEYGNETITTLFGALTKMDIADNGEAAANLVNLALRKRKEFEDSNQLRVATRAVEKLPKTVASEKAVAALLQYRNGLEHSLDLDGADEMNYRLLKIAENVIDSSELHVQIKALSESIARRASEVAKRYFLDGGLTKDQDEQVKQTFARIMGHYKAI